MRTTARNTWLAALTMALAGCISIPWPAPEAPTAPDPPPVVEPARATLAVVVIDRYSKAGLEDALVELHTGELALTNADGYVAFEALLLGSRGVAVVRDGYYDGFEAVWTFEGNTTVAIPLDPIPPPAPPPPPPLPPEPVPDACGPISAPTSNRLECVIQVSRRSIEWPKCTAGSGAACHRFVREVVHALAAGDPRWSLITKQAGQTQCSCTSCGPGDGTGYGEDVAAYLPAGAPASDWIGYDLIGGAGASGARVQWDGPLPRRPGNVWATLPGLCAP